LLQYLQLIMELYAAEANSVGLKETEGKLASQLSETRHGSEGNLGRPRDTERNQEELGRRIETTCAGELRGIGGCIQVCHIDQLYQLQLGNCCTLKPPKTHCGENCCIRYSCYPAVDQTALTVTQESPRCSEVAPKGRKQVPDAPQRHREVPSSPENLQRTWADPSRATPGILARAEGQVKHPGRPN